MGFQMPGAKALQRCNSFVDDWDVGAGPNATCEIYGGAQQADLDSAPAGQMLCEIDFAKPAMSDAVDADPHAESSVIGNPSGVASVVGGPIDATHYIIKDCDGNPVTGGSIGAVAGAGIQMVLAGGVSIADGATITIQTLVHRELQH